MNCKPCARKLLPTNLRLACVRKTEEDYEESMRKTGYTTDLSFQDLPKAEEECYTLGVKLQKTIMSLELLKAITVRCFKIGKGGGLL